MGVVYRARDTALGRDVALKFLPDSFSPALRECLLREADASARLQHPAIATYFESGEDGANAFIAMELVHGETLRHRLRGGPLPLEEALAVTSCLLEALAHAHASGILHCDIKPENIMLPGRGAAKLLDFGLVKPALADDDLAATFPSFKTLGAIGGTIGYLSPEQIRREPLDGRSDVYQVGLVLYEMLSGRPPFPGASVVERLTAPLTEELPPITETTVGDDVMAVLYQSLAVDSTRRFPSAAAFLSDLTSIRAGEWHPNLPDTLAIPDFQNLGADRGDDWIGTAFAESLSTDLARSRDSVFSRATRRSL